MSVRSPEELPAFSLLSVLATIRRQWLWMFGSTLVGVGLTVFFTLRQRPVYEAHATLRLAEQQSPLATTDVLAAMSAPSTIETEMEIIRSRSVAEDVVDTLGLRVRIVEPKGELTHNLFSLLRVAREAPPGSYVVERDPGERRPQHPEPLAPDCREYTQQGKGRELFGAAHAHHTLLEVMQGPMLP